MQLSETAPLFSTVKLGSIELKNRLVMAPMTRSRADADGIQTPLAATYYSQRAEAGLIITEATAVTKQGSGYPVIPGIWNDAQVEAWKPVADAIHAKGGLAFLQIFHTGRIAHSTLVGETPVAPSAIAPNGETMSATFAQESFELPRALTTEEIPAIAAAFGLAAKNAIAAGFDGVEIHGANGYLIDQFLRDGSNKRTDAYGEDRTLFLKQVLDSVIDAIGAERVGVRLSPWTPFNSMSDSDLEATFRKAASALAGRGLAYLHILNGGNDDRPSAEAFSLELAEIAGLPLIINGGYDAAAANAAIEKGIAAVAFGIPFLANPDLVKRIEKGAELNAPDFATFYVGGEKGYTDYPELATA
jgi:N-ethylmaleimide reductase